MNDFEPLVTSLEGWFERSWCELPEPLRARVEDEFVVPWDGMTADQRRSMAAQLDYYSDPANDEERQRWWDFEMRRDELLQQLDEWIAVKAATAGDLGRKEERIAELKDELARMEEQAKVPRGDCPCHPETEKGSSPGPTGRQDADPPVLIFTTSGPDENGPDTTGPTRADGGVCEVFRAMVDLQPRELKIAFMGDESEEGLAANNLVEVSARGKTRRATAWELRLVDRRKGALNKSGAILIGLAHGRKAKRRGPADSAAMKRLRADLCEVFGFSKDPFAKHDRDAGWQPLFEIVDRRGLADVRAREIAERRTVSLDRLEAAGYQYLAKGDDFDDEPDEESGSAFDDESDRASDDESYGVADDEFDEPGEKWLRENDPKRRY